MSESYFQTKRREELAEVRKLLAEVQRNALEAGPDYIQHEEKFPGRIANFMDQAVSLLDDAESMIAAMAPSQQQKALWTSFRKTLQLADYSVRQALWDPSVQRDSAMQESRRKPRRTEINDWIESRLRHQKDAKSPELWDRAPDWITDQIQSEAFARRVTAVRGKLGLKNKKQR